MAVEERDFDGDVVAGLLRAWANNTPWYEIDFGRGRWSGHAMSIYDRALGFSWAAIAERRARTMWWWDNLDVHSLEDPGGVEIPLWLPGHGSHATEGHNFATEGRTLRRSLIQLMSELSEREPELAWACDLYKRDCLIVRDPGPQRWATAKEWVRPGD